MDAPEPTEAQKWPDPVWLTRREIDLVIESMTAGDLVKALSEHGDGNAQMPVAAFDSSAKRLGLTNGSAASDHVRASDLRYLGEKIGEAVNVDSPLSPRQEDSQPSAITGG